MADRFAESNNILIQSLKDNGRSKNTQQSTNNWINVWGAYGEQKGHDKSIEGYEPVALNKILQDFYATVRKKNGEDYEPDSLHIMVTAMDRYLADKGYKYSIIRGREIQSSKQVLEGLKPGEINRKNIDNMAARAEFFHSCHLQSAEQQPYALKSRASGMSKKKSNLLPKSFFGQPFCLFWLAAAQKIAHAAHSLSRLGELHVKAGYVSTLLA